MATRLALPREQVASDVGAPLPGAKLYFYSAGTSTAKNTYSDAALTTPNANPVVADAGGRFADVFLTTGSYKMVLKTSADVTVWTADPVDGAPDGAGDISTGTVKPAGGSTLLSLATLFGYHANVRHYGAVGDGVADDTTAITLAAATGKPVYLPSGTYKLTASVSLGTSGQRVYGEDENLSIIVPSGNFDVFKPVASTDQIFIESLTLNCSGMTGGFVVNTNSADRIFVARLRINDPYNVFSVNGTNLADFKDIYVQSPRGPYGFYLGGSRSDVVRMYGCNFGAPDAAGRTWTGIYWDGYCNTVQCYSCTFVNSLRGLHVLNSSGVSANNPLFGIFHDLEVDFCASEAVKLDAGEGFWFTTLYAQGSAAEAGFTVGSAVNSVKVANGYIRGHLKEAAVISGQDCVFMGCQFVFVSFPNYYSYNAVRVGATAERVQFTGCSFGGLEGIGSTVQYGLEVDAGASSVRVSGSDFYGCAVGDVLDNSGSTSPGNVQVIGCGSGHLATNSRLPGFEMGTKDGSGASATPTIALGQITGYTGLVGGSEYTVAPSVFALDPLQTGSGFAATATISGGAVTAITITNPGTNYSAGTLLRINSASRSSTLKARFPGNANAPLRLEADGSGTVTIGNDGGTNITLTDTALGFYGKSPISKQTGVTVDAAGIHAALVALGLFSA